MTDQDRRAAEEIALLPCPFCGGEPRLWQNGGQSWITCRQCGGKSAALSHPEDAKNSWNRRALVQKAREEERPKWQPIETAPKDRFIFLWCPEDQSRWFAKGQADEWYGVDDLGLTRRGHSVSSDAYTGWFVTQWMPLPPRPRARGAIR